MLTQQTNKHRGSLQLLFQSLSADTYLTKSMPPNAGEKYKLFVRRQFLSSTEELRKVSNPILEALIDMNPNIKSNLGLSQLPLEPPSAGTLSGKLGK